MLKKQSLNNILSLLLLTYSLSIWSQDEEIYSKPSEKSFFGVQVGLIGLWVHHEARLVESIVLRSELGLDMVGFFRNDVFAANPENSVGGPFFAPTIALEPRWYYSLQRRSKENKPTTKNSASFISFETKYYPDLFLLTGAPEGTQFAKQLAICPRWGFKRTVANNFTYELGIGYKIYHLLNDVDRNRVNDGEGFINMHLKLGYTF
ncbi:hypothetical protein [Flagellimonas meridianipacifica]|uniref:Lipid A 3-O-deacylase PagL n=1 Tax=Flagellimonas meridianipacifica TaxID=1080225 RepID=A0A2T0MEN2_9FLAO|nr:hypothetical protein [Allomuricauda pacifica]PRX56037.1 hypothetical protein CLV81_0025 [Allomuricauda pacifica]